MSYEIKIEEINKVDEEYVGFHVKITVDEKHEIEDYVRMSYEKQYNGEYEWESPNCDLGSLIGLEDDDDQPEFKNENWGQIIDETRIEIQNWLNKNMDNKNTN